MVYLKWWKAANIHNVRPVRVVHFTVGWPVVVKWGWSTGQLDVRWGSLLALSLIFYCMCLCPSVNHSSWAVLLLNGYSKSTRNSSGENGYAKLFNTSLNLLGQSQLVLPHISYPLDLLSLSWSLLPHCAKKMLIFLHCNGQGAACRFFSPDRFTRWSQLQPFAIACWLYPIFLSGHFPFSPFHWSLNQRALTALLVTTIPTSTLWLCADSVPDILQHILLHALHTTQCLCSCKMHHPSNLRVLRPCLSLTSLQ